MAPYRMLNFRDDSNLSIRMKQSESQKRLLQCSDIKKLTNILSYINIEYEYLFENLEKQVQITPLKPFICQEVC